ncbi:MAG TPA: STAS domain-containing protein [Kofleriaceae bacterium]|jgi:rsbT antagonist protein RsbS|nr:STAS domain-containing protein [Kofleriaceae bacterium]
MSEGNRVPIIRLWNLLLVPVQGELTDSHAEQLRHDVLTEISAAGSDGLVIDVTGLWMMDSHLCAVLTRLAQAAALMGTKTVMCGISADIAMTIQSMGLELRGVRTALSLEEALDDFGVQGPPRSDDDLDFGDASAAT